jgi:cystathionine beta-lyase/cystathionine gamma-synthase
MLENIFVGGFFMNEDLLIATHFGEDYKKYSNAVTPPIFMNSLHLFDTQEEYNSIDVHDRNSYVYGRVANPTVRIVEDKIAALERGEMALMFASGMAAATSVIMTTCKAGSHIICLKNVYQPVRRFIEGMCIPNLKMTVSYVSGLDLDELENQIRPETSLIILESPSSFVFTVFDIKAITDIAKKHGVKTYIDNTYCTPIFQKPLELGVDIVMHTLSKYLGGHSDIIGGVLVSKDKKLMQEMMCTTREWFGGIIGPFEAWLVLRGIRTLNARVFQHQETAMAVAEYLEGHPKVKRVYYTGLKSHPQYDIIQKQQTGHTGLMSFELDAPPEMALKLINSLELFGIGCSWGGFESLALAPLYCSSEEEIEFLHTSRGLIRIHCGLEGKDNLIADLDKALKAL